MGNVGRRKKAPPGDYLTKRGVWPDGPFVKNSPAYVHAVAGIAFNLRNHMQAEGLSLREVARRTDVNPATLSMLLNGTLIPDTATLAQLEHELGVRLWG